MTRRARQWLRLSLRGLIVPALLLLTWEAAARLWLAQAILIPPPSEVMRTFAARRTT